MVPAVPMFPEPERVEPDASIGPARVEPVPTNKPPEIVAAPEIVDAVNIPTEVHAGAAETELVPVC